MKNGIVLRTFQSIQVTWLSDRCTEGAEEEESVSKSYTQHCNKIDIKSCATPYHTLNTRLRERE